MSWEGLLDAYLESLRLRGRSPATLEGAALYLGWFVRFGRARGLEEPAALTSRHVAAYRVELGWARSRRGGLLSPHTVNALLGWLRGLTRWAVRRQLLLVDPCRDLVLRQPPRALPRILTVAEVERLLAAPDPSTPLGLRNRALLETFYGTGVRRREGLRLDLDDLHLEARVLYVRRGKGGRDRALPIGESLAEAMARYLRRGRPWLAPRSDERAVFLSRYGRRLSLSSVDQLFWRLAERSGVGRPLHAHLLRHAFASHLLEGGADLLEVSALLGHALVSTTEIYTHLSPVQLHREHERTHPRARRRRRPEP